MKTFTSPLVALALLLGGVLNGHSQKMNTESKSNTNSTELATYGGGCFWCVEAIFQRLDGVKSVASGYAGGKRDNPTYEEVCAGTTGHAEVIQIEFDPSRISYEDLLDVFWQAHDPTTLNRQGADVGTQYRSIILYHNERQKAAAEKSKQAAASQFKAPIVTEIVPLTKFYIAERYHQNYFNNNPKAPYCSFVIRPKLDKLLKKLTKVKPEVKASEPSTGVAKP
jgi:peptide-methionine (S)-S-oxide reductase